MMLAIILLSVQILCQVLGSNAGFNCTSDGYFPDPTDVHKFYQCSGGFASNHTCPGGKVFDAKSKFCEVKPTVISSVPSTTFIPSTISSTDTTQAESTTKPTETTTTQPHPGPTKFHCMRNTLSSMVRCFKNESNAWKRYLTSSSGNVEEIVEDAVNSTDKIFDTFQEQRNSSKWFNPFDVLNILDDIGRYIALKTNKTVTATNEKMHMEVTTIKPPYRFPDYSHNSFPSKNWKDINDVIILPKGMFPNSTIKYRAVSMLYLNLKDKLSTDVYETNNSHVINSHVLSSFVIPDVTPPFNSNVIIVMKHLKVLDKNEYSVCAFWDFSIPSARGMGVWSRRGCHVVSELSNNTYTTCSCNHLTNFAILMGSEDVKMTKVNKFALSVITYVGCALSLFGSVAAIGVLLVLTKGLHTDRNLIHCNLLISIAISQTVFLAGVEHTEDKTSCKLTAILLHYFYLVSFAWMLCEGLHLYAMVIKVFNLTSRVYHYVAFSWGTPLIIVLITVLSRFKEYGTPTSCWISSEYYTQLAFILPITVILMVNIFILSLVMKEICKLHVSESSHIRRMINSSFKTVVVLFPLLGITWVFGLLVFSTKNVTIQYIFAASNSLQGFFIFVLHCLFNSEIRKNFKRKKEVWKSLRIFEDFRRRVTVSIIPIRVPVTKQSTSSNERAETFEKSAS